MLQYIPLGCHTRMTAKAVIGPKPPGVDNGDVTDTGIQDSAIRTAVAIVEYDFSN
jgi:hypothetical protein